MGGFKILKIEMSIVSCISLYGSSQNLIEEKGERGKVQTHCCSPVPMLMVKSCNTF